MKRWSPRRWFVVAVLASIAIAGISAIAIGADPRVSLLSWPALVVTFALGRRIGREEVTEEVWTERHGA